MSLRERIQALLAASADRTRIAEERRRDRLARMPALIWFVEDAIAPFVRERLVAARHEGDGLRLSVADREIVLRASDPMAAELVCGMRSAPFKWGGDRWLHGLPGFPGAEITTASVEAALEALLGED